MIEYLLLEGVLPITDNESARHKDATDESRELAEEDGKHHRPRRADDLFVGG